MITRTEHYMLTITTPFSGGCACGAIRYQSMAEPIMMLHCHCRDCQQSSGGPFSSFVIMPTEAFKLLQGSLRFHASPSEAGGQTRRGFCPECGSPMEPATRNVLRSPIGQFLYSIVLWKSAEQDFRRRTGTGLNFTLRRCLAHAHQEPEQQVSPQHGKIAIC